MTAIRVKTTNGWQDLAVAGAGVEVYEQAADPGAKPVGSIWIDTDELPFAWASGIPLVAVLPTSPMNAQEVYYLADAANGVIWHLRYRVDSASAYKWEVVGGPPMFATVETAEGHPGPNGQWVNLATNGPGIVLPLAGDYLITYGASANKSKGEPQSGYVGIANGDTSPAISSLYEDDYTTTTAASTLSSHYRFTGLSAGLTLKMRYFAGNSSGTAPWMVFSRRRMTLLPMRVG